MDLIRKLELAENAIRSIAGHDDAPAEVVQAALAKVITLARIHGAAAKSRREKKAAAE